MKKQLPLTAVVAVGLAVLLVAAYMLLIRPKGNEAAALEGEIADLQAQAAVVSHQAGEAAQPKVEIDVADLFRLAKALPDRTDMAGIMVELNAVAASAGVSFESIQPSTPVGFGDFSALPINLTFRGNYYDLTDFLYRLRNLVTVKDGVLDAEGRLYTLDSLDMHEEPDLHFPNIEAVLTLSAYSYGASPSSDAGTPAPAPSTTDTSSSTDTTQTTTDTTTTSTTTTSPNDSQAAGAGG